MPRWVAGPHPGVKPLVTVSVLCQPYRQGQADLAHWLLSGVTTDHALWPNRHHNRQSAGGMNRVTGTHSSEDHFVTEEHLLLLNPPYASLLSPEALDCTFQVHFSTTHCVTPVYLSSRPHCFPGYAFLSSKEQGFFRGVVAATATRGSQ